MKMLIRFIAILAAALCLATPASAQDPLADLYGTWKIQSVIGSGAASSMSNREARQLVGKTFVLQIHRFVFNDKPCIETRYEQVVEATAIHFDREWNVDVSDLPLPDPVTVIDTGCNILYPLTNGHVMVAEKGVFFEAAKVGRARQLPRSQP